MKKKVVEFIWGRVCIERWFLDFEERVVQNVEE